MMGDWRWFRFYSEFRGDPKLSLMSPHHQWAFVILLCLANENKPRGYISGLSDEEISYQVRMALEEWQVLKERFKVKGMIEIEGLDQIKITHWDARQFASDNSTERVRKHRAKKATASSPPTPPSESETDHTYRYRGETFHETFQALQETSVRVLDEPIAEPIAPQSPDTQHPFAGGTAKGKPTVKGDRSAGSVEDWNIEAREWLCHEADWRESLTSFKEEMLQAVADSNNNCDFAVTATGRRNDTQIGNHIRKLERRAKYYYGEQDPIDARAMLLEYWKAAKEIRDRIEQRKALDSTLAGAVPISMTPEVQPIAEPIALTIARLKAKAKLPQYRTQALAEAQQLGLDIEALEVTP